MKKLFASMLAATMVAGMSVSAFAYVNAAGAATTADALKNTDLGIGTDGYDFAIDSTKAVDKDGKKVTELGGGDKIYYPIVVSGEELEIGSEVATDYYYATKSSEVDGLTVKLNAEIGGKYVDSVSVVKEDLGMKAGNAEATKASFTAPVSAVTVTDSDLTELTVTVDGTETEITLDAALTAATDASALADAIAKKMPTVTIDTVVFNVTADGANLKFEAATAGETTVEVSGITVAKKAGSSQTGTITATVTPGAVTNGTAANAGTSIGKIYCVEVKMADYFGDEAKEVEFNLTLRNGSRIVFETEDDATAFAGEFELGKDSEALKAGEYKKFRNNEITIEIDANTGVIALDEAYLADGVTKEDIEFIYLEGKDANFTFDVKASGQDPLYLELNQDSVKEIAVNNSKADLTFFNFPGEPEFDFTGVARFGVEDEDKDNYLYEIVDGKLIETKAKYNEEDGVFELRTNKLGSYVVSDTELDTTVIEDEDKDTEDKEDEVTGGTDSEGTTGSTGDKNNANTGAADLIGVASALAVVSVAAAGAVALKK